MWEKQHSFKKFIQTPRMAKNATVLSLEKKEMERDKDVDLNCSVFNLEQLAAWPRFMEIRPNQKLEDILLTFKTLASSVETLRKI